VLSIGTFYPATEGVIAWGDGPTHRVQFLLTFQLLVDALGARQLSWGIDSATLCEQRRNVIEVTCRRAYRARPSDSIQLTLADFEAGAGTEPAEAAPTPLSAG
jgi:hypothetical protein